MFGDEGKLGPESGIVFKEDVVSGHVHGAGLLADIAWPESNTALLAIISVHGGRWRGGYKPDGFTIVVRQWAGFGLFAMSIDDRLVGCTPAPACYQDLQCAPFCPRSRQPMRHRYASHLSHRARVAGRRPATTSVPPAALRRIENALLMVEALKKASARHRFHRYPATGHTGINEEVIKRSRVFLKEQSTAAGTK